MSWKDLALQILALAPARSSWKRGSGQEADLTEEGNEISSAGLVEPFGNKANPTPSPMTSWRS